MNWVVNTLKSSVGKKLLMGVTGLLLCLFLIVHLAGNLLMYVGPDAYNAYAHTPHSQEWFVKIAEVGLLGLFGLHIWLGLETSRENRSARSQRYRVKRSKIPGRKIPFNVSPENYMLMTGVIVLAFLLIHLDDFTFNLTMPEELEGREPFDKAMIIMRHPVSFVSYLVGVILLGWHLAHGVTSMFQTLGLRHPKYDGLTQKAGPVFALIIAVGFASFPIYAVISPYDPYAAPAAEESHGDEHSHQEEAFVVPSNITTCKLASPAADLI